ncbi:enhancer of polycomb-like-domain-containing protein [Syncephalastrum racemosum]|uniref:Enhancer of polycomb-like protein n=1 Tax=Syncephalastrum racemosum TaxID=13706 RepID=A0A1X2H0P4_SYNRA|nr:enhancer of polycomb-like-domain-containing protein [Syncephalastrum racemosum]
MVSPLRVKKLSAKHALPIFKESQLPDIHDEANTRRSVPQIETGVEKEEEEEHDLQAALSSAQAAVTTGADDQQRCYIPTPKASQQIPEKDYRLLYTPFKAPINNIRFSSTVEETGGCHYVIDEQDEAFLARHNAEKDSPDLRLSESLLEDIMDKFETITNTHMPHLYLDASQTPHALDDLLVYLPKDAPLRARLKQAQAVFAHWRERRIERQGKPILPTLQFEEPIKNKVDSYTCFRRRETKPVRKTRRADQQSLERLRRLRTEMESARNLLEMVLRREKMRKEALIQGRLIFDKRCELREYQLRLGIQDDDALYPPPPTPPAKKRKSEGPSTTIKIPLGKLRREDQGEAKKRKTSMLLAVDAELTRKHQQDKVYEDVSSNSYQPFPLPLSLHFFQSLDDTTATVPQWPSKRNTLFRRRVGRGGRVHIDRTCRQPYTSGRFQFDSDGEVTDSDTETIEADYDDTIPYTFLQEGELLQQLKGTDTIPAFTSVHHLSSSSSSSSSPSFAASSFATAKSPVAHVSPTTTPAQQAAIAMTNELIAAAVTGQMRNNTSGKSSTL